MACWKPQASLFNPRNVHVGDKVTIDSTEFFEVCLPRGRCNAELNVVCGGRPCEDPRGVHWKQVGGPYIQGAICHDKKGKPKLCHYQVQANESGNGDPDTGYQLQVEFPEPGEYIFCVDPLADLQDALGKPVVAALNAGKCITIQVQH